MDVLRQSHTHTHHNDYHKECLVVELQNLRRQEQKLSEFYTSNKIEFKVDTNDLLRIFSHLQLNDLLNCRLTCSHWNNEICTHLLWPKVVLVIKNVCPSLISFAPPGQLLQKSITDYNMWNSFSSTPLISVYKCPSFHFEQMDLRREIVKSFFKEYGSQIHHLDITNCDLSLVTFQRILSFCSNLEYFQLKPVSYHSIIYCESISSPFPNSSPVFGQLKILILSSDYKKHFIFPHDFSRTTTNILNNNSIYPPDICTLTDTVENQLSFQVLDELLSSASSLQTIQLYGWTGDTVISVLQSLANQIMPAMITTLEFHDLLTGFNKHEFETLLEKLENYKLNSFALTFLNPSPTEQNLKLNNDINSTVQLVFKRYSNTLQAINLKNCPINARILDDDDELYFKELEVLDLVGTHVENLEDLAKLAPKLKCVHLNHKREVCTTKVTSDEELTTSFDTSIVQKLQERFLPESSPQLQQQQLNTFNMFEHLWLTSVLATGLYFLYPFFIVQFGGYWGIIGFILYVSFGLTLIFVQKKYATELQLRKEQVSSDNMSAQGENSPGSGNSSDDSSSELDDGGSTALEFLL